MARSALDARLAAALLTGCRYGKLASMRAGDFDLGAGTMHVPRSKGGKARHVVLSEEGTTFFRAAAAGKPAGEILFRCWSPEA
jgi:integrase